MTLADQDGSGMQAPNCRFNASDSDVMMESADGVVFRLHSQNLKINTGAFSGSEFSSNGQPRKLTEDAEVLDVVFAYIYPRRYPSLEAMDFPLVAKVAEAVEKYEVFPGMCPCAVRMNDFLPDHADDVLAHGAKYGYLKLVNEAALSLCRSHSMSKFTHKFPLPVVLAWIKYSESWKAIFQSAIDSIQSFTRIPDNISYCHQSYPSSVCSRCRVALLTWVMEMEKIESLPDLKNALGPLAHHKPPANGLVYCKEVCTIKSQCLQWDKLVKVIEDGIAEIQPFEKFFAEFT